MSKKEVFFPFRKEKKSFFSFSHFVRCDVNMPRHRTHHTLAVVSRTKTESHTFSDHLRLLSCSVARYYQLHFSLQWKKPISRKKSAQHGQLPGDCCIIQAVSMFARFKADVIACGNIQALVCTFHGDGEVDLLLTVWKTWIFPAFISVVGWSMGFSRCSHMLSSLKCIAGSVASAVFYYLHIAKIVTFSNFCSPRE